MCKNLRFCWVCKADRTTWKLTLQDINKTPKEPKTGRGFWFFRCRVDVLQSWFPRNTISFAKFSVSTQCLFLLVRSFVDLTFCGIFVCGPLQFKCPFLSAEPLASAVGPRSSKVFLAGGWRSIASLRPELLQRRPERALSDNRTTERNVLLSFILPPLFFLFHTVYISKCRRVINYRATKSRQRETKIAKSHPAEKTCNMQLCLVRLACLKSWQTIKDKG